MKLILNYFIGEEKVLAQDFVFEYLESGTYDVPVFGSILGIEAFNMDTTKRTAETTTYDSNGVEEHIPAGVGYKLTLDCLYEETDAGVQDAGQAYIQTLADAVGTAGIGVFSMTSPGGLQKKFKGSVSVTQSGGKDAAAFKVTIMLTGAPEVV